MESVNERERLTSHLSKLRDTRGKKLLDGKSTVAVTTAIKQTETGLDEVDDAARETERREQSDAKKRRATERSTAQAELQAVREEIMVATKSAHDSALELVKQLRLILAGYESARVKAVVLGDKIATPWMDYDVISRCGFRLARMMSTISARSRNRLGPVQWSLHGYWGDDDLKDWRLREAKILGLEMENDK